MFDYIIHTSPGLIFMIFISDHSDVEHDILLETTHQIQNHPNLDVITINDGDPQILFACANDERATRQPNR